MWDGTQALKVVRDVARDEIPRFANYPDIDREELVAALLLHVATSWATYKPTSSSFPTWVRMVAKTRVVDVLRSRSRRDAREQRYREMHAGDQVEVLDPLPAEPETVDGEIVGGDGQLLLVDRLSMIYRHAHRIANGPEHRERRTYTAAQFVAAGAIGRQLKETVRGLRAMFLDRADLRRVVEFSDVPSYVWFWRAMGSPPDETLSSRKSSTPPAPRRAARGE